MPTPQSADTFDPGLQARYEKYVADGTLQADPQKAAMAQDMLQRGIVRAVSPPAAPPPSAPTTSSGDQFDPTLQTRYEGYLSDGTLTKDPAKQKMAQDMLQRGIIRTPAAAPTSTPAPSGFSFANSAPPQALTPPAPASVPGVNAPAVPAPWKPGEIPSAAAVSSWLDRGSLLYNPDQFNAYNQALQSGQIAPTTRAERNAPTIDGDTSIAGISDPADLKTTVATLVPTTINGKPAVMRAFPSDAARARYNQIVQSQGFAPEAFQVPGASPPASPAALSPLEQLLNKVSDFQDAFSNAISPIADAPEHLVAPLMQNAAALAYDRAGNPGAAASVLLHGNGDPNTPFAPPGVVQSFASGATNNALPALGGNVGAAVVGRAAATIGRRIAAAGAAGADAVPETVEFGPWGLAGIAAAGVLGFFGGDKLANMAQDAIQKRIYSPETLNAMRQASATAQQEHPTAYSAGALAIALSAAKVDTAALSAARNVATAVKGGSSVADALASPAGQVLQRTITHGAINGGVMASINAGMGAIQGGKITPESVAGDFLMGAAPLGGHGGPDATTKNQVTGPETSVPHVAPRPVTSDSADRSDAVGPAAIAAPVASSPGIGSAPPIASPPPEPHGYMSDGTPVSFLGTTPEGQVRVQIGSSTVRVEPHVAAHIVKDLAAQPPLTAPAVPTPAPSPYDMSARAQDADAPAQAPASSAAPVPASPPAAAPADPLAQLQQEAVTGIVPPTDNAAPTAPQPTAAPSPAAPVAPSGPMPSAEGTHADMAGNLNVGHVGETDPQALAIMRAQAEATGKPAPRPWSERAAAANDLNVTPEELAGMTPGTIRAGTRGDDFTKAVRNLTAFMAAETKRAAAAYDADPSPANTDALNKATSDYAMVDAHRAALTNSAGGTLGNFRDDAAATAPDYSGVSSDAITEPQKGVAMPTPPDPAAPAPASDAAPRKGTNPRSYGRANKVFTADAADAARARLKANAISAAGKLNTGLPLDAIAKALPDLVELGGYHLEAGLREFGAWSTQMQKEAQEAIGAKLTPGALQTVWAGAKADAAKRVQSFGGARPASQLFADQLARILGSRGRAVNFIADLNESHGGASGTDTLDRLIGANGDASKLSADERARVVELTEQYKATRTQTAPVGGLKVVRDSIAEAQASARAAKQAAKQGVRASSDASIAAPEPPTPEQELQAALGKRVGSARAQKMIEAINGEVDGPRIVRDLAAGKLADADAPTVLSAYADNLAPKGQAAAPHPGIAALNDALANARSAAREQERANRVAPAVVKAVKPPPDATEVFTRGMAQRMGGRDAANAFRADLGPDLFGRLVDSPDILTDSENQRVAESFEQNRARAQKGVATANPPSDAIQAVLDAVKEGRVSQAEAARTAKAQAADEARAQKAQATADAKTAAAQQSEADRAAAQAARTPTDDFLDAIGKRVGIKNGARDRFAAAVPSDLLDKAANDHENLTADEKRTVGNAYAAQARPKPTPAQTAENIKTLQAAGRSAKETQRLDAIRSLSPKEKIRESLTLALPRDPATGKASDADIEKLNADLAEIKGTDTKALTEFRARRMSDWWGTARAAANAIFLRNPSTLGNIATQHLGMLALEEAKRPIAAKFAPSERDGFSLPASVAAVKKAVSLPTLKDAGSLLLHGEGELQLRKGNSFGPPRLPEHQEFTLPESAFGKPVPAAVSKPVNAVFRTPMRIHSALYHVLQTGIAERSLWEESQLQGARDAQAAGTNDAAHRAAQYRAAPPPEIMERVWDTIARQMFVNDNDFTKAVSSGTNALSPGWKTAVKSQLPFVKVPSNVVARGLESTPLGILDAGLRMRAENAKPEAERDTELQGHLADRMARGLTGTALSVLGYAVARARLAHSETDDEKYGPHLKTGTPGVAYRIGAELGDPGKSTAVHIGQALVGELPGVRTAQTISEISRAKTDKTAARAVEKMVPGLDPLLQLIGVNDPPKHRR